MADRALATTLVTAIERDHGDALLGFICRLGLDPPAADDVVQDALLRLYDELVRGKRVADPRAWVFTVAYRIAMDEHRRRERASRLGAEGPRSSSFDDDLVSRSERLIVWAEVDRLPERQRHVVYLRYRADLAFDAIGSVLGITSSAARSHATQAVATLRARLVGEDAAHG